MESSEAELLASLRKQMAAFESVPDVDGSPAEERREPSSRKCASSGDQEEAERAFKKIQRLAAMREHSSDSLRKRLVKDGFSEQESIEAVDRAVRCGLVSDARFADVLVRSRRSAGKGRAGIARELESHGIDPENVPAYAEWELQGEEAEVSRALSVLERRPPRSKNVREGAYRRLVQKGFSSSVSSTAARLWSESASSGAR